MDSVGSSKRLSLCWLLCLSFLERAISMLIDTHLHTCEYSDDSFLSIAEAVARARELGLEGLCVTDHDTLGAKAVIAEWRRRFSFPLFLGAEVLTTAGDFIVFGLDELPREKVSPEALIKLVRAAKGAIVAAHPYRNNGRGAGDLISTLPQLDGVESFNGSTSALANLKAFEKATQRGLAVLGAGDAHSRERVGLFATEFRCEPQNEGELAEAIRQRQCRPVAWNGECYLSADSWCRGLIQTDKRRSFAA